MLRWPSLPETDAATSPREPATTTWDPGLELPLSLRTRLWYGNGNRRRRVSR